MIGSERNPHCFTLAVILQLNILIQSIKELSKLLKMLYTIVHFEAVNILVMLRLWAVHMKNQKCTIYCDYNAVINVYTNHKIQYTFLTAYV